MSNKYIKISANQQQFSDSLNNVDFTIPEGYNIDLSKSKLLINCVPSITQQTANLPAKDGLTSVYELVMRVEDASSDVDIAPPSGSALVKNCLMRSQRAGLVESIRRVDCLKASLANYTKDIDEKRSLWTTGLDGPNGSDGAKSSMFVNYVKTGTQLSEQIPRADVSIPLHEIMDVCEATAYDTSKYGQTHLHFEMNFDKLKIKSANVDEGDGDVPVLDTSVFASFTTQTSAADGTTVTTAVSDKATNNPEQDFPFYVGQSVVINATVAGGAAADFTRRIESIIYNSTNGFSRIAWTNSIGTIDNTQTCVFNSVKPAPAGADPSYTIDNVQLELKLTDEEPPAQIQYTTYSTEEDSFTGVRLRNKMYQVEPEADNLIVCVPNDGLYSSNLLSNYRFRVDNVEQSRNNVVVSQPEHKDNLNKLFLNMDLELKDTHERVLSQKKTDDKTEDYNALRMGFVGVPLPMTQNQKNVNFEFAAGANVSKLILYKRMMKSI